MGMRNRKVKGSVEEATASLKSSSVNNLPVGYCCRRGQSAFNSEKQSETCSLYTATLTMMKMKYKGKFSFVKKATTTSTAPSDVSEGESKMRNVRLSLGGFDAHHDAPAWKRRSNSAVGSDGCIESRFREGEAVRTSIDLVTPHCVFLSNDNNNSKSNKETHSFTSPPSQRSTSSSSSSCASANDNSNNVSSVSEEEIIKPLRATNSEKKSNSQEEEEKQQLHQSPHQSKSLVLTHDQRKMKRRRRGILSTSLRDSMSSFHHHHHRITGFSSSSLLLGLMFIIATLIHSSHEQSFFSPSSDEWDGGSFRSGTYGNGYTCVNIPVNFTLCKNIGYTKMMIPNLLGHDSLQEAEFHAKSWVPLLGLQCHPDTQLFLCSLFSPICLDRPIYPCRSLCQGVQAKCEPRMLAYNYPWPSMLKCDQFPEDHDLCIRPGAANKSDGDPELECPSCNQAHTCENIVDNFCRADFVFRAKHKRSKGAVVEFRKERFFKPREGNRRGRELRALNLDSKDDCCATKLRQGFPYIVMGIKRGDDYIITFAMQWNPKDKILKNAVRTFRSMDCTNPLPMSVTAAGGKLGAERNGTAGAGRRRRRKQGRRRNKEGGGQHGGCRVSAPGRNN